MLVYKLGSKGEEVRRIQERLRNLGYYLGPLDGEFGGGTFSAVRRLQRDRTLEIDGKVGRDTWKELFGDQIVEPSIVRESVEHRSLALTGSFETGKGVPECFAGNQLRRPPMELRTGFAATAPEADDRRSPRGHIFDISASLFRVGTSLED